MWTYTSREQTLWSETVKHCGSKWVYETDTCFRLHFLMMEYDVLLCPDLYIWSIAHPGRFATNAVVRGDIRWDHIDTNGVDHSHWTADMGYYADTFPSTNLPGNLYLSTNSQPPWNTLGECLGFMLWVLCGSSDKIPQDLNDLNDILFQQQSPGAEFSV